MNLLSSFDNPPDVYYLLFRMTYRLILKVWIKHINRINTTHGPSQEVGSGAIMIEERTPSADWSHLQALCILSWSRKPKHSMTIPWQSAFNLAVDCIWWQGPCIEHKTYEMMTLIETVDDLALSTCLSVTCLVLWATNRYWIGKRYISFINRSFKTLCRIWKI